MPSFTLVELRVSYPDGSDSDGMRPDLTGAKLRWYHMGGPHFSKSRSINDQRGFCAKELSNVEDVEEHNRKALYRKKPSKSIELDANVFNYDVDWKFEGISTFREPENSAVWNKICNLQTQVQSVSCCRTKANGKRCCPG